MHGKVSNYQVIRVCVTTLIEHKWHRIGKKCRCLTSESKYKINDKKCGRMWKKHPCLTFKSQRSANTEVVLDILKSSSTKNVR